MKNNLKYYVIEDEEGFYLTESERVPVGDIIVVEYVNQIDAEKRLSFEIQKE